MKKIPSVELNVTNFRSISRAAINLDGITVVSGPNGCGKSTVSKLLYTVFSAANDFEGLVLEDTQKKLRPYMGIVEQVQFYLYNRYPRDSRQRLQVLRRDFSLKELSDAQLFMSRIRRLFDDFKEMIAVEQQELSYTISRLKSIIQSALSSSERSGSLEVLVDKVQEKIGKVLDNAQQAVMTRPYHYLGRELQEIFDERIARAVSIKEFGQKVIGDGVTVVPIMHEIKKVAYIDTPMSIGFDSENPFVPQHWRDLNRLLKEPARRGYKRSINTLIKKEIIKGDVSYNDDVLSGGFKYRREDNAEFDLMECATGIKSFALLQLLLKNLFLDENTLLVLDEPEAHLHPQWVVEYARLIVLLHKKLGVKFFIASHSSDMVSALKYIAKRNKAEVNFYFAQEAPSRGNQYEFVNLGQDIEETFASFNRSLEKIDEYGG